MNRAGFAARVVGSLLAGMLSWSASAQQKVTFLIHPTVYEATGGAKGVIADFTKETGIAVEVVTQPIIQLHEKAMVEWFAKSGRYDVTTILDGYLNNDIATRYLEPLDPMIEKIPAGYDFKDIIPSLFDTVKVAGKTYGMPFQGGVVMLFYRKDLFDKYKIAVPKTINEVLDASRRLNAALRKDGNNETYALGVRAKEANVGTQDFLVFFFAAGGDLFLNDDTRCGLNSPAGVATARFYADLVKDGLLPRDVLAMGRDELIGGFQQGRLAMVPSIATYYAQYNDPAKSKVAGNVGWTVMPTAEGVPPGRTFKTFWYTVLDRNSKNKEAAWRFMQYMSSKPVQARMAASWGFGPGRTSAFAAPEVVKTFPHAQDWGRGAAASVAVKQHPEWPKIQDIVFEELASVINQKQRPEAAVARMCDRIQPLLKK